MQADSPAVPSVSTPRSKCVAWPVASEMQHGGRCAPENDAARVLAERSRLRLVIEPVDDRGLAKFPTEVVGPFDRLLVTAVKTAGGCRGGQEMLTVGHVLDLGVRTPGQEQGGQHPGAYVPASAVRG
jgi:hypothetical protein